MLKETANFIIFLNIFWSLVCGYSSMMISCFCHHDGSFSPMCEKFFSKSNIFGEITKWGKTFLKKIFERNFVDKEEYLVFVGLYWQCCYCWNEYY